MEKWTRSEEEKLPIYIIRCNEPENGLNVSHETVNKMDEGYAVQSRA